MKKDIAKNFRKYLENSEKMMENANLFKPKKNKSILILNAILWFSITGTLFLLPSFYIFLLILSILCVIHTFSILFYFSYQEKEEDIKSPLPKKKLSKKERSKIAKEAALKR